MNTIVKNILTGFLLMTTVISCKKSEFVEENTDPEVLYGVQPADQFAAATYGLPDDFETYYDNFRRIMFWMQMSTADQGNRANFTRDVSNFNKRYQVFYNRVGARLSDIESLISKMPAEEQESYMQIRNIAKILKAYYAFYVSDINGSIPYSEAFEARYTGNINPKYDKQSDLFATLDQELKDAVAALKTTPTATQATLGNKDMFFSGDVTKWIKTGNAARLRIAMRMTKVDLGRVTTIVNDVLSVAADQMENNDDSWVYKTLSKSYGSGGNWSPIGMRAPKPTLDFMVDKADPRLRLFYSKTLEGDYVGSYTSPDESEDHPELYARGDTGISHLQYRLFDALEADQDGNLGEGINFWPLITYADVCFMRAELAASGITTESAEDWYNEGVRSSITFYDKRADEANIVDYLAVTPQEINDYLAMPGIAFNSSIALDQIATQSYLNFNREPNEAWALYKRTGMPNATTVLSLPVLTSGGSPLPIARRAPLGLVDISSPNHENKQAAFAEMALDPGFGTDPNDAFGRVWWDKP